MKNLITKITMTTLALTMVLSLSNCEAIKNANNKQKGAVIGTAGAVEALPVIPRAILDLHVR